MTKSFKYVLLDIDNTLYDYERSHAVAQKAVVDWLCASCALSASQVEAAFKQGRRSIHHRLENTASSHNRLLYFQAGLELLGCNAMPTALHCYELYWNCFLENTTINSATQNFLSALDPERTCFVTDLTADVQFRKVRHFNWHNHVRYMVTSEEAGVEKPHPRIFEMAMKKLGARPAECCMIGDNWEKDVLGATALGIFTYWLSRDSGGSLNSHPLCEVIRSLQEYHV